MVAVGGLLSLAGCDADPPPSPYAAPPDAPYRAEDVEFAALDGRTLSGTLTLPLGGGPWPGVVTVSGSGRQDRDEHIRGVGADHRPFRDIADALARRGVATLRFDDPGVGGSEALGADATPFDYADDVRAALAYLRSRPEVDGTRAALLGHSEGGVVAPHVAASDSLLAGLVLLAAPAYTLRRVNRQQRGKRFELSPSPPSAEQIEAELDRTDPAAEFEALESAWRRAVWNYDPLPTARTIAAPVLVLHGATDQQISPDQADTLAAALRAGRSAGVTLRVFPQINHMFLSDPNGNPAGYRSLPSHRLPTEVLETITDWLVVQFDRSR